MFGISLIELFCILIIAILVIGKNDFSEIARFVLKTISQIKHFMAGAKNELSVLSKDMGIDKIKQEVELEVASSKKEIEGQMTTIIDLYGNEHQVPNISEIRKDKTQEELEQEVNDLNKANSKPNRKKP